MNHIGNPGHIERTPPHNEEAEQALLGAILINNRAYEKVSEFLRPEHFYDPAHQRIFAAISEEVEAGRKADPVTLRDRFASDADLAGDGGGAAYLARLVANVVTVVNSADYGRIIHELFLRRQQIEVALSMLDDAYDVGSGRSPEEAIAEFAGDLDRILDIAPASQATFTCMRDAAEEALNRADAARRTGGGLSGVSTGLIDLDRLTGGLQPTDLIIIAGRPSMGKTTLLKNIAVSSAKRWKAGLPNSAAVGIFSLEMSAEQLAANFFAEETGIATPRQRQGHISDDEFVKMTGVDSDIPLFIDTTADSLPVLVSRARRLARKHKVGVIGVDYIQLMSAGSGRTDNRVQEITQITRGLKKLARELGVPVVALSQLSRQVEQREDKRPMLADLRDSGSIEQDADVVIFCYREQYYLERAEPNRRPDESDDKFNNRHQQWQQRLGEVYNIGEAIIAKQRMGAIATARLCFDGPASKFSDLDTRH
ncbi:replicative DNA helicase [Azospirillum aestuarii]|uniref:replicative DNA helicase n=1 Tax=Azospirillum aestuarii TaxID=2802052 RepID=UPI004054DA40